MEVTTTLWYILVAVLSVVLYQIRDNFNYWKKRGIPHDEPDFFYGNMKGVAQTRHLKDAFRDIYNKYKKSGPFCGVYFFFNPAVLVLDLDLAKKILVKDFNNFIDRGFFHNEKQDPLSAHIFAINGGKWASMRKKLSPTFTSAKMKMMFPLVIDVGYRFAEAFGSIVDTTGSIVEIKEINARYTTDVIGTCAFGIECNSLKDPNAEFRLYGRKAFTEGRHHPAVYILMQSCPNLARKLGLKITPSDVEVFFMNAVKETVAYREMNGIKRNDFMDILIDLKNKKPVKTEDGDVLSSLTMEEIAAQAFVFFLAGFETSSSTLSFALYELALNTNIQKKLRSEIDQVLARHNGVLTYEGISEMNYMNQVIEETLRMYSIVISLQRIAKEDYDTGDPRYKIEKGSMILIPSEAIHYDPEIYPNPEKFDPDRFTPEEKLKRDACAWLPFGEGPRNCIGLRFGKMQTKIGLAVMIKNFKFSACEKTQIPLQIDVKQPQQILATTDGIFLKAERV